LSEDSPRGRNPKGERCQFSPCRSSPGPAAPGRKRTVPFPGCGHSQLCSLETASQQPRLLPTQRKDEFKSNKAAAATSLAPLADRAFVYLFYLLVDPGLFSQSKYQHRQFVSAPGAPAGSQRGTGEGANLTKRSQPTTKPMSDHI